MYVIDREKMKREKKKRKEMKVRNVLDDFCLIFLAIHQSGNPFVFLDVRNRTQYDICSLPHSHNIPLIDLSLKISEVERIQEETYPQSNDEVTFKNNYTEKMINERECERDNQKNNIFLT